MKLDTGAAELKAALEQTEAKLEELCRKQPLPGLSVAIVYDQDMLWARGFGYANLEQQIPATPKTIYQMASVTAPEMKLGIAAFTNTDQGEDNRMENVTHDLLLELVGVIGGVIERSAAALIQAGGWRSYLGHYAYPGHPGMDIEFRADNLVAVSRFSHREFVLHPTSEHHFRVEHQGQVRGQAFFEVGAGAQAVRFVMDYEVFERVE